MKELFFNLLEVNIGVSVVIVPLCLFAGRLRGRYGAGWMKVLWLLLSIRLAIPYNISLPFAEIRLLNSPGFARTADSEADFDRQTQWEAVSGDTGPGDGYGASQAQTGIADMDGMMGGSMPAGDNNGVPGEGEQGVSHKNVPYESIFYANAYNKNSFHESILLRERSPLDYADVLLIVWLAGMGACLLYTIGSGFLFDVKCHRSMYPIRDADGKEEINDIQRMLTGQNGIPVYRSRHITSPMLTGILRPRLVLPSVAARWSDIELELMLAHELCHYKKKDLLLKLFVTLVWCVNWFNPAVWLLKKQFSYDMELACDESVLAARDDRERETYARLLLLAAGGKMPALTTGFTADGRRMKRRIAHVMDGRKKKRGVIGILVAGSLIMGISVAVSCGYRPETAVPSPSTLSSEGIMSSEKTLTSEKSLPADTEPESSEGEFNYNHEYNEMLRVYRDNIFLDREDGIYRISGGADAEELVFANPYALPRGMELYGDFLYFCGSTRRGEAEAATIYSMNLDTLEIKDALAAFSNIFTGLHRISVYEDKLYVASSYTGHRIGFTLMPDGMLGAPLDESAEDYLYKEYNDCADFRLRMFTESDSGEYERSVSGQNGKYQAVLDVAFCKRLLGGKQVVSCYNANDSLMRCLYLEDAAGDYEYLCDIREWSVLVMADGIYYIGGDGGIRYMDFADKQEKLLWVQTREWARISLLTYDASYIWFVKSRHVGYDAEDASVSENYLMRIPRQGGEAERVYRFENDMDISLPDGLCGNCGIYGDKMYIRGCHDILLEPDQNGMQGLNNGERSADSLALEQAAETFAQAYFENDAKTCHLYLTDDFSEPLDLYEHPEHAGQIEKLYLGGLPEGDMEAGARIWLSYEFREYGEDSRTYLTMKLVKTLQGWRVAFYGLEK